MNRWKRYLFWIGWILLAFLLIGWWYKAEYSMGIAESYEVNEHITEPKVLIATQQSVYKEMVTKELVSYLEKKDVYVKVMDINKLDKPLLAEYDAIIIMHTWEMWKPPVVVKEFVAKTNNRKKIFLISTSGDGNLILENVDGITSASDINNAQGDLDKTIQWLNKILSLETGI